MRPDRRDKPTADADVSKAEGVKAASNQLRGTIGEELSDGTPGFSPESQQLLKFHGIYQTRRSAPSVRAGV